jgi:hypothetical protein
MNAFVTSLKEKPELLAAIARFNAPKSSDFDPETLPALPLALLQSGTLEKLEGSRAGKTITRAWIFQQLGIKKPFTDFSQERHRLALLGKEALSSLAMLYGACIYAKEIASRVRREEVAALRGALGAHYEYVLSRGRFQMLQASEYFSSFKLDAPLPERMLEAGFVALRICLDDWPEDLRRLAAPRLPGALRTPSDGKSAHMLPIFWADLKKLLLTQMEPRWQTCFA